jgi:hypothetical protein
MRLVFKKFSHRIHSPRFLIECLFYFHLDLSAQVGFLKMKVSPKMNVPNLNDRIRKHLVSIASPYSDPITVKFLKKTRQLEVENKIERTQNYKLL